MKLVKVILLVVLTAAAAQADVLSKTVVVPFAANTSEFRPDIDAKDNLKQANDASLITIKGRASGNDHALANKRAEQLSLQRALSARAYLIKQGVSPLKISINYAPGDYIADNRTGEGKQQNRRVEIEMIYVPTTTEISHEN